MDDMANIVMLVGSIVFAVLAILFIFLYVMGYRSNKAILDFIDGIEDKDKKTTNLKVSIEYLPEELTLFSPCPICGQPGHRVQWSNVSETGTYMQYNDEFTCKPFMSHECEFCGSQIHFDTNLPKDELVEWITQSCEIINNWNGKS